jgi:plasmid maintenance system antidote protein VapI
MPAGITQTAFAESLGWTRARLNELIKGKRGITADAALDLAKARDFTEGVDEPPGDVAPRAS